MKLKSFFNRIPRWLIVLVILAALYFIFNKRTEGFACYRYRKKNSKGYCEGTASHSKNKPTDGYNDVGCRTKGSTIVPDSYCN